jgi:predicted nucleic acid-binding protein
MIKVVCNASPIIGLSKLGILNILYEIFEVYIPQEVYNEIILCEEDNASGKEELLEAVLNDKIKVYKVKDNDLVNKLYGHLHKGEIETVIAAKEMALTYVIIDEKSARSFAKTLFLKPIGTIGVLQRAKELNKINRLKPLLDTLRNSGLRISDKLYFDLLKIVGE